MNPRKIVMWAVIGLLLLNVFGTGCSAIKKLTGSSGTKQSQSKPKPTKIGVILAPEVENQAQIKKGLQDAAKKEGAQLVFLDQKQLKTQGKGIKALIVQGGSQTSNIDMGNEDKQKIPIVAIDQVPDTKVEAVVMPDYYRIGELQANYLKTTLKTGNIVVLQSAKPGAEEVVAGAKTVLAQNPGLKILQTFTSPTKNSSPTAAFDDYLKSNPGKVQAVLATDSRQALEAIEVLKKYNLSKKIQVVGAGTDKQTVDKIASGELNADVDKSPYLQGMYAYKLASQLSKQQATDADQTVVTQSGETPAKLVPVQLVRTENLAQFQKIYAQPVSTTEAETGGESQGKQTDQGGDSQGGDSQGGQSGDSQDGTSQGGDQKGTAQSSGQQSSSQASKAAGVAKVREKIRTETTREMLDKNGKVLGTENEVHEEVRTLPQALLEATKGQQDAQKDKGKQDQQGKQGQKDQQSDQSSSSSEGQ